MEVLLFNLSLNLLLRGFPSEPSYLTEHFTKPYFINSGLVALVTSCSGTRFHFVKAHYVSPVSKLFTLAYRLLPFRLTSRFYVLAGFTVNERRQKTASVTPWTQS